MASGPITSRQIEIEKWRQWQIFFSWALKITVDSGCSHEIKRPLFLGRKTTTNIDSILKKRHVLLTKLHMVKGMFFPHIFTNVRVGHKEGWALKNRCFQIVLEKTFESPLDHKEIQPVFPKGNQPFILTGRTDAEAEAPILWSPDAKSWLIGKDPDAGKDWGQEEKGATEDEIVEWLHLLGGHEGQQSLACCSPWDHKESDTT